MEFDISIDIATGMSARSRSWKNKKILWSKLVKDLSTELKTNETLKEYLSASKDDRGKIKDVGGYVGAYLRNGRRKPENVAHRQLITLDIDYANADFWSDFCLQFGNAAVVHATHSYCDENPRLRLIMPLSREVTPDEYVAVSRKIAGSIDIEQFDNTGFQPYRLMFWPSSPSDIDYYFRFQDGPLVDPDEILESYVDWTDSSLWPTAFRDLDDVKRLSKKQQDPEQKKGVVGSFCRAYTITEVIEDHLSDLYIRSSEGRYTYIKGTTASGVIVYDDKFTYSHHGTDPTGGKLCNVFDLVRIHKYGHLDSEGNETKSFAAMQDLATKDVKVKASIAVDKLLEAKYDFSSDLKPAPDNEPDIDNIEWMTELEVDSKSRYLSTAPNLNLIFANDVRLKNLLKENLFDKKRYLFGDMPWRKITDPEPVRNVDYSGIRNYIECIYGIAGNLKIDDSMAIEFERNSFHPVHDYLNSLKWDGVGRVDNLLIDYFGADDNIYSKEAIRKMLVGAVARIMVPGIKFDLVLILVSDQGTGKSTFIKKLGKDWFSDSFTTVQGKEAYEQIQGAWLIEMAELSGLRKGEVEHVKHFITKQEDTFRPAYGRIQETYKRQCVFFGTTNDREFLKDPSGNRRFIPVDVHPHRITKDVFSDLDSNVDQVWAEAVELFRIGEKLFMSDEAEHLAKSEQSKHSETDERKGLIENYLSRKLPIEWDKMDIHQRKDFLNGDPLSPKGVVTRDYTCISEIWCECLGNDKKDMDRYKTRPVNDILRTIEGWDHHKSTKNFSLYGKQKYYSRNLF